MQCVIMKVTLALCFLASHVFAFGQEVKKLDGVSNSVVCTKNKTTLGLTIVQGKHGNEGSPGLKGDRGERGEPGDDYWYTGKQGERGPDGVQGPKGEMGDKGERGYRGLSGPPGIDGLNGPKGDIGEPGVKGPKGESGLMGETGNIADDGEPGQDGLPRLEQIMDVLIHSLNDYQVTENGYYNNIYHVTSHDLTDGRSDSGGWGSETVKAGNYIQATYVRPVYVTSVTVAGGFIPSWDHDVRRGYGKLNLQFSTNGSNWETSATFPSPVMRKMITVNFKPVTAQYWRLISTEDKWVGTTEFALKPLIKT